MAEIVQRVDLRYEMRNWLCFFVISMRIRANHAINIKTVSLEITHASPPIKVTQLAASSTAKLPKLAGTRKLTDAHRAVVWGQDLPPVRFDFHSRALAFFGIGASSSGMGFENQAEQSFGWQYFKGVKASDSEQPDGNGRYWA